MDNHDQQGPLDHCAPLEYALANITQYVLEKLGDRCAMPSIVAPTAIIYGLILLIGLLGNVCTCLVICFNKSMQNPTNYYLFSLAVSDLLILTLGLPMELYGVFDVTYPYKFSEFVCKGRAFLIEFTSYASILTITCFSVERWLAICFPLRIKLFSTLDRAIKVILAVWICAFLAASPVLDIVVVNKLPLPDWALGQPWLPLVSDDEITLRDTDTCAMDFHRPLAQRNFILLAFLLFFLLPALLITLVYCHIVHRLCSSARHAKPMLGGEQKQKMRSRKSLLKILVSVVVMFFLCWLPFHVQRLLSIYLNEMASAPAESDAVGEYSSAVFTLFSVVFYISGYCYYSNSACNPILYNTLSAKYRMAFCRTILGDRLAYKLLNEKYRSSTFGPALHSHLHSKWSASSLQRQTISPKLSSGARPVLGPNSSAAGPRVLQLCGDSVLMVAGSVGPTGAILLAHKRSLGSPLGRQNSHPRRIRRELTWTRGETSDLMVNNIGAGGCRKFSEERWRKERREKRRMEEEHQQQIAKQNGGEKVCRDEEEKVEAEAEEVPMPMPTGDATKRMKDEKRNDKMEEGGGKEEEGKEEADEANNPPD